MTVNGSVLALYSLLLVLGNVAEENVIVIVLV